jgi:hypothetical protein
MKAENSQRRSVFYPFGMVGTWLIVATVVIAMGVLQVFTLPQGSGFPKDTFFWKPVVPFAAIALVGFGISRLCARGSTARDVFLSAAIASGGWCIAFGLLLFATGERVSIEDVMQATPTDPENTYVCTRKSDGGMECLNAFGEPSPNYSYTIVKPEKAQP